MTHCGNVQVASARKERELETEMLQEKVLQS